MESDRVFSWAIDATGAWKHVEEVPRGLQCGCYCPHCLSPLEACQGPHPEKRSHGFTHHDRTRKTNLEICYEVSMYKLAEYIIQTRKRIYVPSYHEIFKKKVINFENVQIDGRYERVDKQPDVIATTKEGEQYLIEFVFRYKVQHKKAIDYKSLNCLEVDLSNQTFDTLEDFLLNHCEDRRWLNHETYFNRIEETYQKANKPVRVVSKKECANCMVKDNCCAVPMLNSSLPLLIPHNGDIYRLCKTQKYQQQIEQYQKKEQQRLERIEEEKRKEKEQYEINRLALEQWEMGRRERTAINDEEPSCYNCESNLSWGNMDGLAFCGGYISLGIPKYNKPEYAKQCRRYRHK